MRLPLLTGIMKYAFTVSNGRDQMAPWGGTTADVGFNGFSSPVVSVGGSLALAKPLGRMSGPATGVLEAGYALTRGRSQAEQAGSEYGRQLGETNPFLAARL